MRKFTTIVLALGLVLASCQKEEAVDVPGNIPGMGDAVGELQVDPYSFPEGIEILGVDGVGEEGTIAIEGDASLKSTYANEAVQTYGNFGSGGRFVKVLIKLKNTTNKNRTCYFPRGCIFKVNIPDYQHGMLCQWAWVNIKANSERTIVLHLYCINKGKNSSDPSAQYNIVGITKSVPVWNLLRKIGWKKINWECYNRNDDVKASLKSDEVLTYQEITNQLQNTIWALTNGTGTTEEQLSFIESIPMLEAGSYPADLDDRSIAPPYYIDEYTPAQ